MIAIVDVAGKQFKVTKDQKIFVNRLEGKKGDKVEFDKVLLIDNNDKVEVGEPVIKGAMIKGKILDHLKGDKVKVFKKKRRKGYKVLKGHRDHLTQVLIEEIKEKGATKSASKKTTSKTTPKKKATTKTASTKKAAPKTKTSSASTSKKSKQTTKKATASKSKTKTGTKASATKKATDAKSSSKTSATAKKSKTGTTTKKKTTKKSTENKSK